MMASKFSHTTMAKRQAKLNTFLQSVLKQPRLGQSEEVLQFLGLQTSAELRAGGTSDEAQVMQ